MIIRSPAEVWSAARREPDLAILALIVITLPLELSKQLFPIQLVEISRLAMIAGFVVLVVRAAQRTLIPVPRSIVLATLVVIAVGGVSLATTGWPNGIRIEAAMGLYALFAFFVAETVRDGRDLRVLTGALIASGAIVAIVLVLESLFDFYLWREGVQGVLGRRNGTFADPNITSRFLSLAFIAIVAVVIAHPRSGRSTRLGLMLTALSFGAGQALTQSRAGWLTALVPIAFWLAFARRWPRMIVPMGVLALGFAGTVLLNPTALLRASSTVDDVGLTVGGIVGPGTQPGPGASGQSDAGPALAIDPILDRLPLDSVRRYLFRAGAAMFADHRLVGVGLGGFQPELLGPYSAYIPVERRDLPTSLPHTELVRIGAETGIVGLASIALLVFALARVLWSLRHARAPVAIAAGAVGMGILSILISSQFEGRLVDEPYLWLLIGVAAALPTVASAAAAAASNP
ncbi:MAG: O-antigen ligase family protein [Chloroflexota bacterium]